MVEEGARKSAIKQFTSQEALSYGNVKFGSSAEADGGVDLWLLNTSLGPHQPSLSFFKDAITIFSLSSDRPTGANQRHHKRRNRHPYPLYPLWPLGFPDPYPASTCAGACILSYYVEIPLPWDYRLCQLFFCFRDCVGCASTRELQSHCQIHPPLNQAS